MLKNIFLIIFILISSLPRTNIKTKDGNPKLDSSKTSTTILALEASIEATANQICLNESVDITFTGMGGIAPYVFDYTVNGAAETISTIGTDDAVILTVTPTVFSTYELVTVTDSSGIPENVTDAITITVNEPPVIDFTFDNDNTCSGTVIQFNSSVTGNGPYTYQWSFGDTVTSNNANPTHIFEALGCTMDTFTVVLTVTDDNDCTSTLTKLITVIEKPDIAFIDSNPGVAGQFNNCGNSNPSATYSISVGNSSTSTCIDSYTVDWGDGTIENNTAFPADHTYTSFGTFNMAVTATGTNGCANTVSYLVKNATNPSGGISGPGNTQNLCTPTAGLQFEITGWGGNTSDTSYEIDYGDGTTITYTQNELVSSIYYDAGNPTASLPFPIAPHSYTETSCPGEFTAKLWIRNACVENPTPATIGNIVILKGTESSFEAPDNGCVNTSITFINTSESGFGFNCSPDVNFTWDFGDGSAPITTNTLSNISHVFTNSGNYTVSLTADNFLCDFTLFEKNICIEPVLTPTFTLDTAESCAPFTVNLTNTTDESENCGTPTYLWTITYTSGFCSTTSEYNFTNGDANSASPSIAFTEAGTYALTLTTTNSCGSEISTPQTVIVKQPPTVSINPITDACGPVTITPIATVDACSTNTATYNWVFPGGTPATSNDLNPGPISYDTVGNHSITLTVTTECGSTESSQDFTINPLPSITNTDLSQSICSGTETTALILSADLTGTSYVWVANATAGITGYIVSGTTNTIPAHTLFNANNTPGTVTYTITPTADDCVGIPVILVITVNPAPTFTEQPIGSSVCLNGIANILSVSWDGTGPATYQWYTDAGIITGANSATYDPPTNVIGTVNYHCIVTFTSSVGCDEITSDSATVEVKAQLQIDVEPIPNQMICIDGSSEVLIVNVSGGSGIITYQWYVNTINSTIGATLIAGATGNTYTPPPLNAIGDYYYYVVITATGDGCGDATSAFAQVTVVTDPVVDTQPIISQELCQSAIVQDLVVITSGGLGILSYQWYSNNINNSTGGTLIPGATNSTFTPPTNTVGTLYYYCVISQNVSGCETVSDTGAVIVLPAPTIDDQPLGDSLCQNGTTSDLFVTYSNGTGVATYQWYDDNGLIVGANLSTYSPLTNIIGSFNYYCIITFSSVGCSQIISNTASIEIVEVPQIDTQPTQTQGICIGGVSEALTITTIGGSGAVTYQWYSNTIDSDTGGTLINGETNNSYTPPAFNTIGDYYYYVIATVAGNGCGNLTSSVAHIEVVDDPVMGTQPVISQELCANTAVQELEVTTSGGLGNLSYQWYSNTVDNNFGGTLITGEINSTFIPPTTTIGTIFYYCIISQDVSGCNTVSNTGAITITPAPTFVQQPISDTLCFGETTLPLVVSFTNGTGLATYQWYQNNINDTGSGTLINGETSSSYSPTVTNIGTLFYYCIINFSTGGCTEIISNPAEITVNETPSISPTTILICSDNYFEYIPDSSNGDIVPNGTLYTWNTPTINPAGSITGAIAQITPESTISQSLINTTINPAVVTYTVTPISGNCTGNSFDVVVTVNPAISVSVNQLNSLCYESDNGFLEINISGGIPYNTGLPYQIQWTGPNGFNTTDQNIYNLIPGDYTVEINDSGGCPYIDTYTITQPNALILESTDTYKDITCFGDKDGEIAVSIAGGTSLYTYAWTKDGLAFATTEDLSDLDSGTYELTVTDANNCILILDPYTIIEPEILVLQFINQTNIICFGEDTGTITIGVTGGRPNYVYSWTGPNGFTSASQNLTSLIAGSYNVTVTDQSNCIDTLDVLLTQNDALVIDYSINEITCYGSNNGGITINTISGGIAPYTINWSNLGSGMDLQNLSPGNYIITITDAENCVKAFPILIQDPPDFYIDPLVSQISCFGENDARIVLNLVGGNDPISLVWDDDPSAGIERNNLSSGTYTVTIIDGSTCSITETFEIFDVDALEISATVIDALDCDNTNSGAIDLSIVGGVPPYNISWSNNATSEDLIDIPQGNYYVTITDNNGCEIQANWEVNRFEPLIINVETETEFNCETKEVHQTFIAQATGGVPPYQFNWLSGNVSGNYNQIMETDQNGLVIVEVTDSYGCSTRLSYNVETPTLGAANFTSNSIGYSTYGMYSILDPVQFTNTATGDFDSVRWDFGDGNFSNEENPSHTYISEGSYVVTQTVNYPFGCIYTHVITLNIEKGYNLVMPNAFTPNADGLNDYFVPEFIGLSEMQLDIYDTWGTLIYSEIGDDIRGWNGKINDYDAENGNYYFKFSAKTFYGEIIKESGAFVSIK